MGTGQHIKENLTEAFETIFNDYVIAAGELTFTMLNMFATLWFALSGFSLPNIPNIVFWFGVLFWVIPLAHVAEDIVCFNDELDEEEDEEIADD